MSRTLQGGCCRRRSGGFTFVEVIVVLVLIGLMATITAVAWERAMSRAHTMQAARVVQKSLLQARMLAVYRGLKHFVVLDPSERTIVIYEDSGKPFGELDPGDRRVVSDAWPPSVSLAMPGSTTVMPNPLGAGSITRAWFLPRPEGEVWGSSLRGIVATPEGAIASAERTPAVIGAGVIVLSNPRGETTSVGIRGQFGSVRWYRWADGAWKRG